MSWTPVALKATTGASGAERTLPGFGVVGERSA
jgi:hypothetical protein